MKKKTKSPPPRAGPPSWAGDINEGPKVSMYLFLCTFDGVDISRLSAVTLRAWQEGDLKTEECERDFLRPCDN